MTEGIGVMSTSFSEGPVFEDNDSVFSDLPTPSDMNSSPEIPKRSSKHQRKTSTGSSVWNNVIVATPRTIMDECRNDVLFSPEVEEEEDVDQNELFENELRASVLSTKITVNASDADLKDTSAPPLAFFHTDSLHKHRSVDSEKRDSYIPSALFTDSKKPDVKTTAAKSHQRKKSVDDSILDKVITVAKESEDADEEEDDSLFDTVSQLTKDQQFEIESTIRVLIENSGVVFDSAVKNIMENTNFAAEKIEETDCNFLTPLGDITACGDMTQKFWNKDEEEPAAPNDKTFIDFGSLDGTDDEKNTVPGKPHAHDSPDETQEILKSLDGNQVEDSDEKLDDETSEGSGGDDADDDASQHVIACKISKDEIKSLGMRLVKSDNGILISRIDPESDLAASGLKPGMTLLTVNGNLCPNTVPDTVLMIKSTSGDVEVTAVFRGAKLTISPAAPHRGVAVPFIRPIEEVIDVDEENVTSPEHSSGFASFFRRLFCGLGSTDSMNKEAVLETEKREIEEKSISGTTETVSASSPEPEKPVRTLTFRVQRLSWEDPIGVKLKRGKGGIVVAEITKNSPFRFTGLRPGMRIHEINGIGCPGSLIVAENLLKGIENDVELVVTSEEKKPDFRPVPVLFYSDI
ncbi:unnamed protein product [Cylindrotheca closterium]|uniref:PDZ domain-containing protein n=1 Tax=Cylindrotheca closterium TaxID=2856 RepID=A0AAD2FT11_9STRA|nr:unnamed protein product [Cylindrotheca closterium]